jgi:predicted RNase H-like HicB family nuclease
MQRYLVVIEKANENFSAYSPDLPGCIATGKSRSKVTQNMTAAIEMHIEGLRQDGLQSLNPALRLSMLLSLTDKITLLYKRILVGKV